MSNKKILLSINVELWQWIKEESQKQNRSVNNWIETTLMNKKEAEESVQYTDVQRFNDYISGR